MVVQEVRAVDNVCGLMGITAENQAVFVFSESGAYSAQTGHSVHRKLISDPTANWTAIPAQSDHFGAKRRGVNSLLR